MNLRPALLAVVACAATVLALAADPLPAVAAEGQPLAANVQRVVEALDHHGAPLPAALRAELGKAAAARDGAHLQQLLDPRVLLVVHINPETRVKVARGPAAARLQQAGYTPVLVKVLNESTGTQPLRIGSPQAGPVYAGAGALVSTRMQQHHLRENQNTARRTDRFLDVEIATAPPMTANLSGLQVEYAIALIYSSEAGLREATLTCDVGQGTQDLGFRAELPVLFDVRPAVAVKLAVRDHDGTPTMGRFQFVDGQGHVFPPQSKRLAPDLFFQRHIYRADGETVLLPPGEFTMFFGRGPEYRWINRTVTIPGPSGTGLPTRDDRNPGQETRATVEPTLTVNLERWVDPATRGFYSGDPHIHAAGCAHYDSPRDGVDPADLFRQVKGEALHVGSVLTYVGGFDRQRHFFAAAVDQESEPLTRIKYDIEVSGFGSHALGHVCLLNLKEQIYPGADGVEGWPTWTLPVLRWTKAQGGFTGYPHPGNIMRIEPAPTAQRLLAQLDADRDGRLDATEAARGLLPAPFAAIDANRDGLATVGELTATLARVAEELPNLALPERPLEIFVTTAHGVCDFICTMDTSRLGEWNTWYHLLNCGLPLKAAGETDFPCMSGTRVGQGRTYVQLGPQTSIDYAQWCEGLARGRSYVSDGYAHALEFFVNGKTSGAEVQLATAGNVSVVATVAFSPETPLETPHGGVIPMTGRQTVGDTVMLHETRSADPQFQRGQRIVELVVNGRVVASREVPADGREHALAFTVPIARSSWVALRQFPQLHTNPVNVLVAGKPIRASRESAQWALACVDQLWRTRHGRIAPAERPEAERAYEEARAIYRRIADESPSDSTATR